MSAVLELLPIEAEASAPAVAKTQVAIATEAAIDLKKLDLTDVALAQFGQWGDAVAEVKKNLGTLVLDLSIQSRIDDAKSLRQRLINQPIADARRVSKELKSKLALVSKDIGAEEARVVAAYEEAANLITPQIDAAQKKLDDEKQVELDRKAKHGAGVARIRSYIELAQGLPSERIAAGIAQLEAMTFGEEWEEFAERAATAQRETLDALRALLASTQASEAAAAEAKRQAEVQHVLSSLTWHVTQSFGKPASHVQEIIDLLNSTVYSESLGTEVLTAHEAALKQLRMLHTMATQQEALAAQAAAAPVTAPAVEPQALTVRELQEPVAGVPVPPNTQSEKQDGSLPGTPGACARTEAEAAQASGGDEGKAAHAEERAAEPVFVASTVINRQTEAAPADARPPMTTGALCERLGMTVNAQFVRGLGFEPVTMIPARSGFFWRDADFAPICHAISKHVLELAGRATS